MIDKVQRTIPVTYLLNDYRGKFIAEACSTSTSCTHPDVYLVEKVLRGKEDKV